MSLNTYHRFKEDIITQIQSSEESSYIRDIQLRILKYAEELLRVQRRTSIDDYKRTIYKVMKMSEYPSLLMGLATIVENCYDKFMDNKRAI